MSTTLKNKYFHQLIIAASQLMVPLISYPFITRVLGPENIGKVNYVDFLAQLFLIFAAFGIPFYGVREVANTGDDAKKRSVLVSELFSIHFCLSVFVGIIFTFATYKQWNANMGLYLLAIANIIISAFTFDWYIQGTQAFTFAAHRYLLVRTIILIAFFVCIKNSSDYIVYYGIYTIGLLLMAIINTQKVWKENAFELKELQLQKHVKPLFYFFLTASAISVYIYFDTIILAYFTKSDLLVGYYTTIVKLVKVFLTGTLALGTVLLPKLSYLVTSGQKSSVKQYLDDYFNFILVIGLPISAGLGFLAPEIIYIVAGDKFMAAVPILQILALLPFVISLSNLFCFQTLVPFNKERKFLIIVVIGCLISIVLNITLVPMINIYGAAWANIITETVITILAGIQAYKLVQINYAVGSILQTLFSVLLFLPITLCCRFYFSSNYIVSIAAVISCSAVYFVCQYWWFKNKVMVNIVHLVKNTLLRR